ncbi:MAG TPA: hypothetical protein VLA58_01875 [Chitinophagaceae bacterium]|nr:hypothetical protein [Chitinophagaceae bacterium]
MAKYLLLRDNKQTGPHSYEEMLDLGFRKYDLVWVEGKSAAWRYAGEINEFKEYAPLLEEQPFDRFFKRKLTPAAEQLTPTEKLTPAAEKLDPVVVAEQLTTTEKLAPIASPENLAPVVEQLAPTEKLIPAAEKLIPSVGELAPAVATEDTTVADIAPPVESKSKQATASELLKARRVAITMPANRNSASHVVVSRRREAEPETVPSEKEKRPEHFQEKKSAIIPQPVVEQAKDVKPEPVEHLPNNPPESEVKPVKDVAIEPVKHLPKNPPEPAVTPVKDVVPEPAEHLPKRSEPLSTPGVSTVSEILPEPAEHLPKRSDPWVKPKMAAVSEVVRETIEQIPVKREAEPIEARFSTQHSHYLPGASPAPAQAGTSMEEEDDDELIPLSQIPPKPFSGDYTGLLQYTGIAAALVSLLVVGILIGRGLGRNYTPPAPVVTQQPSRIAELKKKLMETPVSEPVEEVPEFETEEAGLEATAVNVPLKRGTSSEKKDIGVRTTYKTPTAPPSEAVNTGEKREAVKRSPATATTPEKPTTEKAELASKLRVSLNEYKVNMFGGIDEIEVTVKNGAAVPVTEAVVELRYILSNKNKKHIAETIRFKNIKPGESKTMPGPKSARGIKLETRLISAR